MSEFMCVGKKDRGPHIPQTYENNCPYCHIKELEGKRPCRVCNSGRQRCSESNECYECYRISVLEAQLDAMRGVVEPHIDDLRKTAAVLERSTTGLFENTIAELRKAAKELQQALEQK